MPKRGYALIAAIIFSILILITAAGFILLTGGRYRLAKQAVTRNEAYYAALGGFYYAKARLRNDSSNFSTTRSIGDYEVAIVVSDSGRKTGEKEISITAEY